MFFCEYGEIFKHSFFHKTPPVVTFGSHETNGSIRLWNFTPLLTVDQIFRSSRSLMFFKIGAKKFNRFKIGLKLQNIAIFIGKHLCWSLFLIRLQAFQDCNFIKMRLQHRCFPVNIAKFLRTTFFIKHVKWLQLIFS